MPLLFWLLLVCTFASAAAQAGELPSPRGPFSVGRAMVTLESAQEQTLLSPDANSPRIAQSWIWYPTDHNVTAKPCEYLPPELSDALYRKGGFLARTFLNVNPTKIRDQSLCGAQLSSKVAAYPLLVLRPGNKALALQYSVLAEDLASHGYIVVGFDVPYRSQIFVMPDGRQIAVARDNDAELVATGPDRARLAAKLAAAWAADTGWVLDQLQQTRLPEGLDGHVDWREIGVAGHSLGGASMAQFCHDDSRCKAGADIDGAVFGEVVQSGIDKPFLVILSNHDGENSDADQAIKSDLATFFSHLPENSRQKIILPKANHYLFSDAAYTKNSGVLAVISAVGIADGKTQLRDTADSLLSFFDAYLKK